MIEKQVKTLVLYRIDQSKETLKDAEILLEKKSYRGSINRSYYAMFYSVLALLTTRKLGTSKHSGAIGLFDKEFVKQGVFAKELSKSLHIAFDLRQVHDYGELIEIDSHTAENVFHESERFIEEVESFLLNQGYL